jgi:hypothetical protein
VKSLKVLFPKLKKRSQHLGNELNTTGIENTLIPKLNFMIVLAFILLTVFPFSVAAAYNIATLESCRDWMLESINNGNCDNAQLEQMSLQTSKRLLLQVSLIIILLIIAVFFYLKLGGAAI